MFHFSHATVLLRLWGDRKIEVEVSEWCRYHSALLSCRIYQVNSIAFCSLRVIWMCVWLEEIGLSRLKHGVAPYSYMVQIPQHHAFTRDLPTEFHCFLLFESDLDVCVVGGDRSVQIEAWRRP